MRTTTKILVMGLGGSLFLLTVAFLKFFWLQDLSIGTSTVYALIPAIMPLACVIPCTVERIRRHSMFPLTCGMWVGLVALGCLLVSRSVTGFTHPVGLCLAPVPSSRFALP